jgi:hypothetical protein
LRSGSLQEVSYYSFAVGETFNFDVYGQGLNAGALNGSSYPISISGGIREMTPAIACLSATNCMSPYRWFNQNDTTTDADRIKARLIAY